MAAKVKKLHRSTEERMVAGVFGGLGNYYKIDPTVLRLAYLLVLLLTGVLPGIILYFVAAFVVPVGPSH